MSSFHRVSCLWPYFLPLFILLALFPAAVFFVRHYDPLIILAVVASAFLFQTKWIWRFIRHIRRFNTEENQSIILHYDPALRNKWIFPLLLERIQFERMRLTTRFGFPLRRRLVIFLFASYADVGRIFGPHYGGTALTRSNAIVIADNYIQESMTHELTHLFSSRLCGNAPPLFSEGLSVWMENSDRRRQHRLDSHVCQTIGDCKLTLPMLFKNNIFFSDANRQTCYAIAGSFTGFLIERFGWKKYRKFYRISNSVWSHFRFRICFGVSLKKAETQWRENLAAMNP